jgi:hypothetical protein
MRTIQINTPDGKVIELTAPDNATPEMIQQKAMQAKQMYMSRSNPAEKPSLMRRATDFVKEQAMDPINMIPGAAMAKLGMAGLDKIQQGADFLGQKYTEAQATSPGLEHGYPGEAFVNAAHGSVIQNAPDAILAAIGGKGAPKVGQSIESVGRSIGKGSAKVGEFLEAPSVANASRSVEVASKRAKVAPGLEATPKSETSIREWAMEYGDPAKKGAKVLADLMDPAALNRVRIKTGHILDFLKVANKGSAPKLVVDKQVLKSLIETKNTYTEALKIAVPKMKKPLETLTTSANRSELIDKGVDAVNPMSYLRKIVRGY